MYLLGNQTFHTIENRLLCCHASISLHQHCFDPPVMSLRHYPWCLNPTDAVAFNQHANASFFSFNYNSVEILCTASRRCPLGHLGSFSAQTRFSSYLQLFHCPNSSRLDPNLFRRRFDSTNSKSIVFICYCYQLLK